MHTLIMYVVLITVEWGETITFNIKLIIWGPHKIIWGPWGPDPKYGNHCTVMIRVFGNYSQTLCTLYSSSVVR